MQAVEEIRLNTNPASRALLSCLVSGLLATQLFGNALDTWTDDFRRLPSMPMSFAMDSGAQLLLLPVIPLVLGLMCIRHVPVWTVGFKKPLRIFSFLALIGLFVTAIAIGAV